MQLPILRNPVLATALARLHLPPTRAAGLLPIPALFLHDLHAATYVVRVVACKMAVGDAVRFGVRACESRELKVAHVAWYGGSLFEDMTK
jgi:hypothetical protein